MSNNANNYVNYLYKEGCNSNDIDIINSYIKDNQFIEDLSVISTNNNLSNHCISVMTMDSDDNMIMYLKGELFDK